MVLTKNPKRIRDTIKTISEVYGKSHRQDLSKELEKAIYDILSIYFSSIKGEVEERTFSPVVKK